MIAQERKRVPVRIGITIVTACSFSGVFFVGSISLRRESGESVVLDLEDGLDTSRKTAVGIDFDK
jgi:hypothetical protein